MDLTITLSTSEVAALESRKEEGDSLEDVLHRILLPIVRVDSGARLNLLADRYRALSPDLQVEAEALLKQWADSKNPR